MEWQTRYKEGPIGYLVQRSRSRSKTSSSSSALAGGTFCGFLLDGTGVLGRYPSYLVALFEGSGRKTDKKNIMSILFSVGSAAYCSFGWLVEQVIESMMMLLY